MIAGRVEALVIARAHAAKAASPASLVRPLGRFAPVDRTPAQWQATLVEVAADLVTRGVLTAQHRPAEPDALAHRIGRHHATSWAQLADKILPALALGVAADDAKTHARLTGRDGWAAAIAGRVLGSWTTGAPLALGALCDAYAWRELGLAGTPKRCPPEVRAVFVQRYLHSDAATPERQIRLLAATAVAAPRPELRALIDALVRLWLEGGSVGGVTFATEVMRVASSNEAARFGDRKVFVASVWDHLRRDPRWSALSLDEFKAQLVAAHRAGALVLARADLVAAMDPALVAASEVVADGASFHFVLREARS
ncbi:MAG TPA: hypothetical protein VGO00_14960 [Kofleriaceae bacterium]|nr:hypothetical protein [Kofleriaceae bacterium]